MAPQETQSGTSTPRSFTKASSEDLLKSQTVGLVNLDDFRKRRAEVFEQREKEAQDRSYGKLKPSASGTGTPASLDSDGALAILDENRGQPPRKRKKKAPKGLLSFGDEEDEMISGASTPAIGTSNPSGASSPAPRTPDSLVPRRLTPNPSSALPAPKVLTKAALQAEATMRDKLRKDFLALQEGVRNTEVMIPFVFYDGTNVPGGVVKVKKGDNIWLFLDRCRKVGAELGIGGKSGSQKNKNDSRREWARISVDDLLLVREEVIIPHHYEFYYFIANKVRSHKSGDLLFDLTNELPKKMQEDTQAGLRIPGEKEMGEYEGQDAEPSITKVVDRRWYEKHKHIFPATLWKTYEAGDGFEKSVAESRRDAQGNSFFFS